MFCLAIRGQKVHRGRVAHWYVICFIYLVRGGLRFESWQGREYLLLEFECELTLHSDIWGYLTIAKYFQIKNFTFLKLKNLPSKLKPQKKYFTGIPLNVGKISFIICYADFFCQLNISMPPFIQLSGRPLHQGPQGSMSIYIVLLKLSNLYYTCAKSCIQLQKFDEFS